MERLIEAVANQGMSRIITGKTHRNDNLVSVRKAADQAAELMGDLVTATRAFQRPPILITGKAVRREGILPQSQRVEAPIT